MKRRSILSLWLILILIVQLLSMGGCKSKSASTLTDRYGKALKTDSSYALLAQEEAAEILAEIKDCSLKKAKRLLKKGRFTVTTAHDPAVFTALEEAYKNLKNAPDELGCAVTDLNGELLAIYSAGGKQNAIEAFKPYGTVAPLAVYAPAIEDGKAFYSSAYPDSPLQKEDGQSWPANPDGKYSNQKTTLVKAAEAGLNTVPVRLLKEYGTDGAAEFLEEKLGLELDLKAKTETAALSALALGEQDIALSPVDIAGFYTIFGNDGQYAAPTTVLEISEGKELIYTRETDAETVIKASTASIVTHMLTAATDKDGIAAEAKLESVPVAGTVASGKEGNWFAGLTPQYACAVWHEQGENLAPVFFAEAFAKIEHREGAEFSENAVRTAIFCRESGLLYGKDCSKMQKGYYDTASLPAICKEHQ